MRVGAAGAAVRFARFVYGALDAQPLHVLVGRDLGVDVMSLDHQRQRHAHDEKGHGPQREQKND